MIGGTFPRCDARRLTCPSSATCFRPRVAREALREAACCVAELAAAQQSTEDTRSDTCTKTFWFGFFCLFFVFERPSAVRRDGGVERVSHGAFPGSDALPHRPGKFGRAAAKP